MVAVSRALVTPCPSTRRAPQCRHHHQLVWAPATALHSSTHAAPAPTWVCRTSVGQQHSHLGEALLDMQLHGHAAADEIEQQRLLRHQLHHPPAAVASPDLTHLPLTHHTHPHHPHTHQHHTHQHHLPLHHTPTHHTHHSSSHHTHHSHHSHQQHVFREHPAQQHHYQVSRRTRPQQPSSMGRAASSFGSQVLQHTQHTQHAQHTAAAAVPHLDGEVVDAAEVLTQLRQELTQHKHTVIVTANQTACALFDLVSVMVLLDEDLRAADPGCTLVFQPVLDLRRKLAAANQQLAMAGFPNGAPPQAAAPTPYAARQGGPNHMPGYGAGAQNGDMHMGNNHNGHVNGHYNGNGNGNSNGNGAVSTGQPPGAAAAQHNGHPSSNGHSSNGHGSNGHGSNGHSSNGHHHEHGVSHARQPLHSSAPAFEHAEPPQPIVAALITTARCPKLALQQPAAVITASFSQPSNLAAALVRAVHSTGSVRLKVVGDANDLVSAWQAMRHARGIVRAQSANQNDLLITPHLGVEQVPAPAGQPVPASRASGAEPVPGTAAHGDSQVVPEQVAAQPGAESPTQLQAAEMRAHFCTSPSCQQDQAPAAAAAPAAAGPDATQADGSSQGAAPTEQGVMAFNIWLR